MGIFSQEKFVELCLEGDAVFAQELSYGLQAVPAGAYVNDEQVARWNAIRGMSVNREAALAVYELAKKYVQKYGCLSGKSLRPWDYDMPVLDIETPWWGFEFETGYISDAALSNVIGHVWDNFNGVAFDAEGEGSYYSEITFTPALASECLDGMSQAARFMKYLSDNRTLTNNTGSTNVGTHFNISVPWANKLDSSAKRNANASIAYVLNNTLHAIPSGRGEYFGRETLYAGCFNQGPYVECKLFRTTYDYETFQHYLKVCNALSLIAEAVEGVSAASAGNTYCDNFDDLVTGTSTVPQFAINTRMHGANSSSYVSGMEYEDEDEEEDYPEYYDDEEEVESDDISFDGCQCSDCRRSRED